MNRLATAISPYLLQHKDNPVDWWPWCPAAFAEARRRDTPVLLSVGYSACHWCHVMAHESFEDPATAALMNESFVCIKVDREERPDIDAVYMDAVVAMTGRGGWPMTAFLTPDGVPFFAGTYYPREHFQRMLSGLARAWRDDRARIQDQGRSVLDALDISTTASTTGRLTAPELDAAYAGLVSEHDPVHGGFAGAPKFPPSMCLEFLLRHHARTGNGLDIVALTAERMARGGLYDQLAGGFARYSVDDAWVVPHFEKMLYDNALLLRVYLHWWRATGTPLARRVVAETAGWLCGELRTPEGAFACALDADSEGEEGRYYVWTPDEVGPLAATLFGVTAAGSFEHGRSVLQLLADPEDPVAFVVERERLLDIRNRRVPPARDDKVVAAWNGLAVAGLAEAGVLFGEPAWVAAAPQAGRLLADVHVVDGRLRRTSRNGRVGEPPGVLEDYGDVAEGLLALHQATGEREWLDLAGSLLEVPLVHFGDGAGGFFDTADDAETLVRRPRDPTDNATPSGCSALAGALVSYAALAGSSRHREAAEEALGSMAAIVARHPRFAGWAAAVGEAALAGPLEVAVVGRPDLAAIARRASSPGAVIVTGGDSPLLTGRPAGAAYVCRGFVCDAPVSEPLALARSVGARLDDEER